LPNKFILQQVVFIGLAFAVALTVQQVRIETDYGNAIGDTDLTDDPLIPGN
jgi:hypothetical protein